MNETGWTDIDVISNGPSSPCGTLLAVAVGGGGTTVWDAGFGSGYVEYTEFNISRGEGQHLRAKVGGAQEATKLVDKSASHLTILNANPGGNGGDYGGADGYSGGGGDNTYGDGGSGGGNGKGQSTYIGGSGSGFDISTIPLKNVILRCALKVHNTCYYSNQDP